MIKKVLVTNASGDTLEMILSSPEKSGFAIKSITGLGPVKSFINTSDYSTIDGGFYNSSRMPSRNIVFELRFLPNPTIEDTRLESYKYFMIKQQVLLEFVTDNYDVTITGYIESNTPTIFSKDEGTQISIICPDPYFYGADTISYSFSKVQPNFEFPFSFELSNGEQERKEISTISLESTGNVRYEGANDTGFVIYIHVMNDISGDITVQNVYTGEYITIKGSSINSLTGSGITRGDSIYISTVAGNKYIQLMRAGQIINILNAFDRDSVWFKLRKGDNFLQFYYVGEPGELQIFVLGNVLYEGI